MYLSIKQHDQFRTLLMGFEIPFRGYIADVLMTHYSSANELETALLAKNASLTPADPFFLRDVLPNSVKHSKVEKMYNTFSTAASTTEIVAVDQDMPMVGALNIITFSLTGIFNDLYNLFADYSTFCDLAEKYRYARNKLDHFMIPVFLFSVNPIFAVSVSKKCRRSLLCHLNGKFFDPRL